MSNFADRVKAARGEQKANGKPNGHSAAEAPEAVRYRPDIICLADVKPQVVQWLFLGRIPYGRLTLLVGRPGAGKSFLTCDIAARLSRGLPWPCGGGNAPLGETLFICAEDDPGDTVVPRLIAAGADLQKTHLLRGKKIEIEDQKKVVAFDLQNVALIGETLDALPNIRLVIIDPIGNYIGGRVDAHRDNEVRSVLMPLVELAMARGVAILLVCHSKKGKADFADDTALGSRAFVGVARSVWHLTEDKTDRARKLLLPGKCNLSVPAPGLAFRIGGSPARLEWEAKPLEGMHADDVLSESAERETNRGPAPERRDAAADWLAEQLRFGAVTVKEIKESAAAAELAWRTVRRASEILGVIPDKQSFSGGWTWRLPPTEGGLPPRRRPSTEEPGHLGEKPTESNEISKPKSEDGQVSEHLDTFDGNPVATFDDPERQTEWTA